MFGKVVLLVLTLGTCGCALLSLRQSRLQAASELVQIQLRIRQHDEHLWKLRSRIAASVTPDHVREMAAAIGPLRPLRPALPGVLDVPETRQVVEMPPPSRGNPAMPVAAPPPLSTSPINPPTTNPAKPKADPKREKAQPARARLATLGPER